MICSGRGSLGTMYIMKRRFGKVMKTALDASPRVKEETQPPLSRLPRYNPNNVDAIAAPFIIGPKKGMPVQLIINMLKLSMLIDKPSTTIAVDRSAALKPIAKYRK